MKRWSIAAKIYHLKHFAITQFRASLIMPKTIQMVPSASNKSLSILLTFALLFFNILPYKIEAIQFPSSVFNNNNDSPSQSSASSSSSIRSVNTPFGIVRGQLVAPLGLPMADSTLPPVVQYLSIPYGSAPTGHHRFKMAISAPKWTHQPKDAFRQPPACIQSGLPSLSESDALKVTTAQRFDRLHRILPQLKPQSEDCLFMNLFVPERRELRDAQPLSVLVLVHGDTDYGWGGAAAQNGTLLAAFGRIVVVTVNYRLGVYGFLGRCDPEAANSCAGNAGLSDLVAALKMLSLLLPSFGADPDSVTLLGWESGAALVSLLMASPITQPKGRLFRRAILLDGSALAPWAMAESPQEQFMRLANELKCLGGDGTTNNGGGVAPEPQKEATRILHCLQDYSTQNLSAAARKVANLSPTFLSTFSPIIDGQVVPNHPSLSFSPKYGGLFREIDLLLGTVLHPAQHLMADQDIQHGVGPERRDKIIRTLVRNIFDFHRTEILQAILNEYTDWENPRNHPKSIRNGLMAALGDLLFTTPLIETARAHSLQDQGPMKATANTFFFVFGHETNGWMREHGASGSGLRGSFTGDHLPYLLGQPFNAENDGGGGTFSAEDKQLCRVMMTYLANFVKSGDPTRPQPMSSQSAIEDRFQGLPWPQFSAQTREAYLEILDRPRVKNFYRNSFVQFWSGFIPVLNRPGADGGKEVPEEHHLLPQHFDRATFFGQPRPFSTYHNIPFPPPPLPPSPFPKELRKQLIASLSITTMRPPGSGESTQRPSIDGSGSSSEDGISKRAQFNPSWGWLILAGGALTFVNLCILIAISKKCLRRRVDSKSKKFQYQSYASPPGQIAQPPPGMDMNFAAMMGAGQQSRRSSQYLPAGGQSRPSRQSAMDFAEELPLHNDTVNKNSIGRKMASSMENGNPLINDNNNRTTASVATIHLHRRRSSLTGGSSGQTKLLGGTFGGGTNLGEKCHIDNSAVVVVANDSEMVTKTTTIQMADEMSENKTSFGNGGGTGGGGGRNSIGQPYVFGKRASTSVASATVFGGGIAHHQTNHRASTGHLTISSSMISPNILTNGSGSGGHYQRANLQEQQQQEPLLSAAGSLKGSTPSVMIQPPATGGAGLIRLGTGISPTCPRHGRAAQMLLAANRTTGSGSAMTGPMGNFGGGQSQGGGGGQQQQGNGQHENQQQIQQQQSNQLEEVQV